MLVRGGSLALFLALSTSASAQDDPFHVEISKTSILSGGTAEVEVLVVVPAGFHVYRDMMRVQVPEAGAFQVGATVFPEGRWEADPAEPDEIREIFDASVSIRVPVSAPESIAIGSYDMEVYVGYQGCKATLCYVPQERTVPTIFDVITTSVSPPSASPESPPEASPGHRWCGVVPGSVSGVLALCGLGLFWRRRPNR